MKEVENAVLDEYADAMTTITEKENTDLAGNFSFYGYEVDRDKLHKNLTDLYAAQKKDRWRSCKAYLTDMKL